MSDLLSRRKASASVPAPLRRDGSGIKQIFVSLALPTPQPNIVVSSNPHGRRAGNAFEQSS